jgi:hypothetical protein
MCAPYFYASEIEFTSWALQLEENATLPYTVKLNLCEVFVSLHTCFTPITDLVQELYHYLCLNKR